MLKEEDRMLLVKQAMGDSGMFGSDVVEPDCSNS